MQPSSTQKKITRMQDGTVKIYLNAAPEKGKANKELIKFLSEKLNISKSDIHITGGKTSSIKTLAIRNMTEEKFNRIAG